MSSNSQPTDPSNPSSSSITPQVEPERIIEASQSQEEVKADEPPVDCTKLMARGKPPPDDDEEVPRRFEEFIEAGRELGADFPKSISNPPPPSIQALNQAGSSAVSTTSNSAMNAALSSNIDNNDNDDQSNRSTPAPSSSSNSKVSPTKKKPELAKQIFISSRNFVPLEGAGQEEPGAHRAKEGGMKRVEKKKVSRQRRAWTFQGWDWISRGTLSKRPSSRHPPLRLNPSSTSIRLI